MADNNMKIREPILPKSGSSFNGMSDSLQVDSFTGTAGIKIPIPVSPSRQLAPELVLEYNTSLGSGVYGRGFQIPIPAVSRMTSRSIPVYDDSLDIFTVTGYGELVCVSQKAEGAVLETIYRPRLEQEYAEIRHIKEGDYSWWRIVTGNNTVYSYGLHEECRLCDPSHRERVYMWLLEEVRDSRDNRMTYRYIAGDSNKYIHSIQYGNYYADTSEGTKDGNENRFLLEVVFDYGELDIRDKILEKSGVSPYSSCGERSLREDFFSSYRSGFEIKTELLCRNICMFHHLSDVEEPVLVKATHFTYTGMPAMLESVQNSGYKRREDGGYQYMHTPPVTFEYTAFSPEEAECGRLGSENDGIPGYIGNGDFQLADLYGEGLKGLLYSSGDSVMYYEPLGEGKYRKPEVQNLFPADRDMRQAHRMLVSLEGNGELDLVVKSRYRSGYYTLDRDNHWQQYSGFRQYPSDIENPILEYADIAGDGQGHMILCERDRVQCYRALRKRGYDKPAYTETEADFPGKSRGYQQEFIGFLQMFGDGLEHRVRIRKESVECWPNLGYGRFGSRILFQNPPCFPEDFSVGRMAFGDLSGTGTADFVYMDKKYLTIYPNMGNNSFGEPVQIALPEYFTETDTVQTGDVRGNGTAAVLFTKSRKQFIHYMWEFTQGVKPYLMKRINNHMGNVTTLEFISSVECCLKDKLEGTPWIHKLPFPVSVIKSSETENLISGGKLCKRYHYRDGFYDGEKREFSGFGYVEEWTQETAADPDYVIPAVCRKMWFRTGGERLSEGKYDLDTGAYPMPEDRFDHEPGSEPYSALAGHLKRQETYVHDGNQEKLRSIDQYNYRVCRLHAPEDRKKGVYRVRSLETMESNYYNAEEDPAQVHNIHLEEDGYGHVTRAVTVNYPRRSRKAYPLQCVQTVSLELSDYINETADCEGGVFVTGLSFQSRSYEINGGKPQLRCGGAAYFTLEQIRGLVGKALEDVLDYEQEFTGDTVQARINSWERVFFWDEVQERPLPLGRTGSRLLEHHEERAVYAEEFAEHLYLEYFSDSSQLKLYLQENAGLCHADGYWWSQGPVHYYYKEVDHRFYLPYREEDDVRGQEKNVYRRRETQYDDYCTQAVSYKTWVNAGCVREAEAEIDYMSLQYCRIKDVNGNISQAIYNPLGMIEAVSFYGMTDGRREGSMDLSEYIEVQPACSEEVIRHGKEYLQGAAKYFYYDLFRYMDYGEPVCTVELERISEEDFRMVYTFCDGCGREVEKKVKEEEGFCVSGYVVNDSKGKPVRQYPAWFSDVLGFEDKPGEKSVPVVVYYDEQERVIRTEQFAHNPTEHGKLLRFHSEIRRTPWEERIYDYNDTVKDSEFYKAFQEHYPDTPDRDMEDIKDGLEKAEAFYHTPLVKVLDSRGNIIHEINYDGTKTTNTYDIHNQLRSCRDSRLTVDNFRYTLDMDGQPVHVAGVDCGEKTHIYNKYGQICASWDGRKLPIRMEYDWDGRSTTVLVKQGDLYKVVEKTVYGEAAGLPEEEVKGRNLANQIYRCYDGAGRVTNLCCNIYGSPLNIETQFCRDYTQVPDWSCQETDLLEQTIWKEAAAYDDCNMPVSRTAPDSSVTYWTYSISGKLKRINVDNSTGYKEIVTDISYNAMGARTDISFGEMANTNYTYDSATHRLLGICSRRQGTVVFQDTSYTYDPAGNITRIRDDTQTTVYNRQQEVEPLWSLTYDPYYRLTEATGRELLNADCNDRERFEKYREDYSYDSSGNLIALRHTSPSVKFIRGMNPAENSNRIVNMEDSGDRYSLSYDENGNMLNLRHVQELSWNYRNQLTGAVTVDREGQEQDGESYVYDSSGCRVRKVVKRKISDEITETAEYVYLGTFQSKKVYRNDTLILERNMLRIDADGQTEALLYFWAKDDLKKETEEIHVEKPHYIFSGITDSVTVELDGSGALISREEYYPYGGTAVRTGRSQREVEMKQYRYKGKEQDSVTGLYCFGARYYAPWMGRWISADPAGTMEGLNMYQYARNNPIAYEDKDGLAAAPRGGGGGGGPEPTDPPAGRDPRTQASRLRRRIGVLYRSDAGGRAHYWDLQAVRQTNPGADVVTIVSPYDLQHPRSYPPQYGRPARPYMPIPGAFQINLAGINAIFVPGGPAAHPDQTVPTPHSNAAGTPYEQQRHNFETAIIQQALGRNIPILAVCGGSWRLGAALGAQIATLPGNRGYHNGSMFEVNAPRHDVQVSGGTLLRRVIQGGFRFEDPIPPGAAVIRGVNSVHWASSIFQIPANGVPAANGLTRQGAPDGITEAFEAPNRHYVLGVQWHPEYSPDASMAANSRIMYSLGVASLENRAAVSIQRAFRAHQARNELRRRNAAVTIQRAFRAHQARNEIRQRNAAAITIQRAFRAYQARNQAGAAAASHAG